MKTMIKGCMRKKAHIQKECGALYESDYLMQDASIGCTPAKYKCSKTKGKCC